MPELFCMRNGSAQVKFHIFHYFCHPFLQSMIVKKFGGTSIGNPTRIRKVVEMMRGNTDVLLVLSAVSGTTDALESLAACLHAEQRADAERMILELETHYTEFNAQLFSTDQYRSAADEMLAHHINYLRGFLNHMFTVHEERAVLAQGELISSALFKFCCDEVGLKAELLSALDFMRLDNEGEPDTSFIRNRLNKLLQERAASGIYITQGYICRNAFGEIDNLKRGGSDYSATLMGAAIQADEIQIWSDVDGMHNNDPTLVPGTHPIRELSYKEAAELAYFGARILHPSCVQPARQHHIPLLLKNTLDPQAEGTRISDKTSHKDKIKAVAAKDDIIALRIRSGSMLHAYGFLRHIFEVFERHRTPIDMITTSEVSVSLTIDSADRLDEIVSELEDYGQVQVDRDQVIICIVGDFLAENHGYAVMVFEALKEIPVRMVSYGGSANNISLLVSSSDKQRALLALNSNLFCQEGNSINKAGN